MKSVPPYCGPKQMSSRASGQLSKILIAVKSFITCDTPRGREEFQDSSKQSESSRLTSYDVARVTPIP